MTLLRIRVAGAFAVALSIAILGAAFCLPPSSSTRAVAADHVEFSRYVDQIGNISRPQDYRTTFIHLGTFAVATDGGEAVDELHSVYARQEDVKAFQQDGQFPDGAAIVKEVYSSKTEALTTGDAAYAAEPQVWFVMIKDKKGRFTGNDRWGDGWGWALFEQAAPEKNVAIDYRTDCRSCHVPARQDDWLYVRGYPLLSKRPDPR